MKRHPSETDLALLAGGDCSPLPRFFLNRHVRQCAKCLDKIAEFTLLRADVLLHGDKLAEPDHFDWDRLAADMRANIHLGLEAGACVRVPQRVSIASPRLAVAFASLLVLLGAGVVLRNPVAHKPEASKEDAAVSVLESNGAGLRLRTGGNSLTLFSHHGTIADQTVSAQGVIRASYIDAGAVTINSVYQE